MHNVLYSGPRRPPFAVPLILTVILGQLNE